MASKRTPPVEDHEQILEEHRQIAEINVQSRADVDSFRLERRIATHRHRDRHSGGI